jgi:hypothetical protein
MTTSFSERMGPVWSAVHGFVPPSELPTQELPLIIKGADGEEYVLQRLS